MKALLLAAGLGTRLRPLTNQIPKCLVKINGKPLLSLWLDLLFSNNVERVLINTHHLPESIERFIEESPWRTCIDLVHETQLLGTGGTLLANGQYFSDAPFIVAHADNLTRFDFQVFVDTHLNRAPGTEMTMMTFKTDVPHSCGIVELNTAGVVKKFHEKVSNPPSNHANAAVYIFEPSILDFLKLLNKDIIDISVDVIPAYLGRIQTFYNDNYHRDIGTLESLAIAEIEYKLFDEKQLIER